MNVLFIHQNFPGQFVHLSASLAAQKKNRVVALTMRDNPAPKNVQVRKYSLLRAAAAETHPMLRDEEAKVLRAEACASAAFQLKRDGFEPDVIVAHPGWGEALFIKDVFPNAKLVIYCEYYYAAEGQDVGFDPEDPPLSFQQRCRLRIKNTTNLLSMEMADAAISPTEWQKSTYPQWAQDKITVIHDGINLDNIKTTRSTTFDIKLSNGGQVRLGRGNEVVSYVARNLEPVRGFHILMRTLPEVLRKRPNAHAVIVGGNEISYGRHAPGGISWQDHMIAEVGGEIDLDRVHFVGQIPYSSYAALINVSNVHTYWTTPFVLSWSFLEIALSGVPVVASDTPPVNEFAKALGISTAPFFDAGQFAKHVVAELEAPKARREIEVPALLDLTQCLSKQKYLLNQL